MVYSRGSAAFFGSCTGLKGGVGELKGGVSVPASCGSAAFSGPDSAVWPCVLSRQDMVGVTWKGARTRSTQPSKEPAPPPMENIAPPRPTISFRDKDAYRDLFQPLPKPEPIPQLSTFKVDN